jgi:hypothetical protein
MESTKKITIQDMDKTLFFEIRLFKALEGLDFMEKLGDSFKREDFSIKKYLIDLLPLAVQLDNNGAKVQEMNLTLAGQIFINPLAIIELGLNILEFQTVFMQNSVIFQPLVGMVKEKLNMKVTE